jgi:hypothetical protein
MVIKAFTSQSNLCSHNNTANTFVFALFCQDSISFPLISELLLALFRHF